MHRGIPCDYPPNTLENFQLAALRKNADGIEFDVRLTRDSKLVVFHDNRLDGRTDGSGRVVDLNLEDLRAIRVHAKGRPLTGTIPTLDDALETLSSISRIYVELKAFRRTHAEDIVLHAIRRHNLLQQVTVSSFALGVLRRLSNLAPHQNVAFVSYNLAGRLYRTMRPMSSRTRRGEIQSFHELLVSYGGVTTRLIRLARRYGYTVVAWTVNAPRQMRRMLRLGVHGIITDDIETLNYVIHQS